LFIRGVNRVFRPEKDHSLQVRHDERGRRGGKEKGGEEGRRREMGEWGKGRRRQSFTMVERIR
jgi:hypothetical protein